MGERGDARDGFRFRPTSPPFYRKLQAHRGVCLAAQVSGKERLGSMETPRAMPSGATPDVSPCVEAGDARRPACTLRFPPRVCFEGGRSWQENERNDSVTGGEKRYTGG